MLKTSMSSLVALGSARRETRAYDEGTHMELIGGGFYTPAGVGLEVTQLGSAREETRAVEDGKRAELVPELRYTTAEVRLS